MRVAAEHVATLDPERQRRLREQEARGELRIVSRAEMRRIIGDHDDGNDLDLLEVTDRPRNCYHRCR